MFFLFLVCLVEFKYGLLLWVLKMPLKRFLWRRCKVLVPRHTLVLPTGNLPPLYVRPWLHIGLVFVIFQGLRNLLRNLLLSFMSDLYFRHCTFNKVSLFCILFGMVNVSWTWIDSSISFGNFYWDITKYVNIKLPFSLSMVHRFIFSVFCRSYMLFSFYYFIFVMIRVWLLHLVFMSWYPVLPWFRFLVSLSVELFV